MQGEIRGYFELEAKELIDRLTAGVAQLDGGTAPAGVIQAMLRAAHTLKGAAHVVEEAALAARAHEIEDALVAYRDRPGQSTLARLVMLTDALALDLEQAIVPAPSGRPGSSVAQDSPAAGDEAVRAWDATTVRIPVSDAEKLHALVVAGVAALASLRHNVERLQRSSESILATNPELAGLTRALEDDTERLARELEELRRVGSQLRLLPVEGLLLEAGRIVRSTAQRLNRPVRVLTAGQQQRVSPEVLAAMQDAMLHLLRNAVAHGLESAQERKAQGKPAEGTIRVEVRRAGRSIELLCQDDGRGIALEPLRRKAVEAGVMSTGKAAAASADELLGLLLLPGFSTAGSLDEVSGRGVGLDAVSEAAARVGGWVTIATTPAQGTTFTLHAPHPVFSVLALQVEQAGRRFAIPVAAVERTFLFEESLAAGGGARRIWVDGEALPLVALPELVAIPFPQSDRSPNRRPTCVVLRSGDDTASHQRRMVLTVDRIVGVEQLLVQPIASVAQVSALIAGAALGTDGVPIPVLEPAGCFVAPVTPLSRKPARAPRPILVIDDSLTTRMLEQSILETEGYSVELASSAEQGLAMARAGDYALYLVDVEMPGMNGFEFVETVSADAQLRRTPAILVTSLNSAAYRERGRAAGAAGYIVKGEFNQQLYLDRIRALVGGAR